MNYAPPIIFPLNKYVIPYLHFHKFFFMLDGASAMSVSLQVNPTVTKPDLYVYKHFI